MEPLLVGGARRICLRLAALALVWCSCLACLGAAGCSRVPRLLASASMPLKRRASPTPETPVEELRNLAKVSAGWLRAVGVTTYGQLCEHELFDLWMALRLQFPQVNRLMYYGMWGALHDLDWRQIPEAEKQRFSHLAEGLLGAPAPPRASGGAARRGPASPPRKRRT